MRSSLGGVVKLHTDVLLSSPLVYVCKVKEKTWAFVSFVQKKKRANSTTQFWYTDISMIALRRKQGGKWIHYQCILQGVKRSCDSELFFDPEFEYCFIPFSYLSGKEEVQCGTQVSKRKAELFRLTSYSANLVEVKARPRKEISNEIIVEVLHHSLFRATKKLHYVLGPSSVLVAACGDQCIYFAVLNGSSGGLMMKLFIESNKGMAVAYGINDDTHILPPKSQCIILVLANDGHHFTPNISFHYQADICSNQMSVRSFKYRGIETRVSLCLAGELICNEYEFESSHRSSKGTIDTRLWGDINPQSSLNTIT